MSIVDTYHEEIIECLIKYGSLTQTDAQTLLEKSRLLKNIDENSIVFHEYPYYWAMHLLYAKSDPQWYLNPKLWPPPSDYI